MDLGNFRANSYVIFYPRKYNDFTIPSVLLIMAFHSVVPKHRPGESQGKLRLRVSLFNLAVDGSVLENLTVGNSLVNKIYKAQAVQLANSNSLS